MSAQSPPLRVLILNQSFWPDVVATAQHVHDLARYFVAQGAEVSVVASRSLYGQSGPSLAAEEMVEGVRVFRVSRNRFGKTGIIARAIDYLLFNVACLVKSLALPRHDVVICLTTPPFISLVGAALRLCKGSRFVVWSMDLYPDLPAAAGVLRRHGFAYRVLELVDRWALCKADAVVALGRCMEAQILRKGVRSERLARIPPWSDPNEVPYSPPRSVPADLRQNKVHDTASLSRAAEDCTKMDYRACWGIGDRYVIQYSGNLGIGHDVSTICQAILALKNDDGIRWVFVGDGVRRPELRLFVEAHGIRNVIFKPYEPRSRLGLLLSLADVHLVSMSSAFEGVILPSKFFGAMAAGRPTIFVGPRNSEVAHVITEQGCGFVVDNDDAEALGEAIRRLRRDPGESLAMGARGRAALSSTYAVQHSCERWWHVVRSVSETRVVTSTTAGQFEAAKIYPENHLDAAPHRLKILIISQYFAPDITAAAYRITDTYRLLRQTGHEVRVITSTPHKGGVDNDALLALGANDLLRVEVRPLGSRSVGAYLSQFFGFVWRAFFQAIRVRRTFDYDVVWASSPPLLLALCTVPLRLVVRRPVVLDIRDVWPESAVSIGKLRRGSAMERIGLLLERAAYRFSDGLTCVSEPMARYLRERTKVPVTVVYNGTPRSQLASCDRRSSNPDRNVFCYAGNLGYAQGLHGVLRAFERFTSYGSGLAKCRLRLIGTGALEGELRTLASALGIADQVEFLGVRPKAEALSIMASSGTLLIPLVDSAAFELTVPSKVFDCMAIGRPIIASIAGEGREILASTGANIVVAPDDVEALSKAFVQMHSHWDEFMAHGHMNVQIVRDKFSREGAVASLECALRAVVSTRETK